jgi:hypothetical protein
MTEQITFDIPIVENLQYVYFDIETGSILKITNEKLDDNNQSHITVSTEDVLTLINGEEPFESCSVVYNTKLKLYELQRNTIEQPVYNVNELIHEITEVIEDADIQVVQDLKNTCWKFLISKELRSNLVENKVSLKVNLGFSITQKNNPNVLYRTLVFPFSQLVNDYYVVLDFKNDFEFNGDPISLYTIKRFDTYSYEVISE